jgi:hypothetical protein
MIRKLAVPLVPLVSCSFLFASCAQSPPSKGLIIDDDTIAAVQTSKSIDSLPAPQTASPVTERPSPTSTLVVADPAADAAPNISTVVSDAEAFYTAYFGAYLAMPNVDVNAIVELSAPGSDSAKATQDELNGFIKDGILVRLNTPNIDVRRITMKRQIDASRVVVHLCQENNWISYKAGPTSAASDDEILNDVLGTTVTDEEWVYVKGKWRPETLTNRENYEGRKCDTFK